MSFRFAFCSQDVDSSWDEEDILFVSNHCCAYCTVVIPVDSMRYFWTHAIMSLTQNWYENEEFRRNGYCFNYLL